MATILTSAHYQGVRVLIDIHLTDAHLPDAVIAEQPYAPAAEREVRALVPDADMKTGDDADKVLLAMMYHCAAKIIMAAPQQLSNSLLQVSETYQAIDWEKKREYLLGEAHAVIDELTPADTATGHGRDVPFTSVGKKPWRSTRTRGWIR